MAPGRQLAVEAVGPSMVPAAQQRSAPCCFFAELRATMATHIVQCVDLTVGTAYHNDRGAQRLDDEIVTVHGDLADMPREHPMSPQEPLHLELEQLRIEVERLREAPTPAVLANQLLQMRRSAHALTHPVLSAMRK